jgi:RNase P subunit RPR2
VIGWQPLILNQRAACADCQAPLARGERVFSGLSAEGPSAIFLCSDCMDERR